MLPPVHGAATARWVSDGPGSRSKIRSIRGVSWHVMNDRPNPDPQYGPRICPYGHPMLPGRKLVGWLACFCFSPGPQHARGHRTYQCRACEEAGWTTVAYYPAHLGGGRPETRW